MKKISLSLIPLLCGYMSIYADSIELENPLGGWRHSAGESSGFLQKVNYPASSVNTEGQDKSSLIKGHISKHTKGKPAKLIVNGIAIPQRVEDSGDFERPYSFGSGSNSIEVRSNDGKTRKQVQFYDGYSSKAQSRLRIVLSWDSDGTDLDLHVVSPDGQHTYYGDRVAPNGGALDVDVTTGYGPEIYASPTPPNGVYHVYVNYYGDGDNQDDLTTAQVAIITQEGTLSEKQQIFQIPMRKAGELTHVSSFSYP
jgi:uncharacterized protein YfaP (DUF2135 family)